MAHTEKAWQRWLERFYNLRRNKCGLHERPHKPVLLLPIFDLLDKHVLTANRVPFSQDLTDTFRRYFGIPRQRDDKLYHANTLFF